MVPMATRLNDSFHPVRTPRSSSTSARCVTTWAGCEVSSGEGGTPPPADGRGQGGRLRARHGAGGPGGAGRPAPSGSASRPAPRRWPCVRRGTPDGCCPGWLPRAPTSRPCSRPTWTCRPTRSPSSRRSCVRHARPEPTARVQLKVDTGLSRGGAAARTGWPCSRPPARPRRKAPSGSPASGRTSRAPTSRSTPPTPPSRRPSRRRSPWRTTPGSSPRCGTWPTRPGRCSIPRRGTTWCGWASPSTG